MATAKKAARKPTIWAILDRERNVQLYVGREPPHLDGAFPSAPRGTRYLGQLNAVEAHKSIGFDCERLTSPSRWRSPLSRNVRGGRDVTRCIAVLLAIAASPTFAAKPHYELKGRVVAIADGDTLTVLDDSKTQHKIRLAGIDAPEKGQPFGTKARENLAAKVFKQDVRIDVIDVDRYKREVGRIFLGERFINLEMVSDGLA